ncbi:MAG: replication-associated recombination protein A [Coprothermobacterota bacterium]|nr:replication-associated recombination protein A [Coprothermobacterota bacterium]
MSLFESPAVGPAPAAPLAVRMRPRDLEEFVGQEKVVGVGRLLRRAIETDTLGSLIFWGPPGCGKTTLAKLIAHKTLAHFSQLSAVTSGVADLRTVMAEARQRLRGQNRRTILFIDEIHRFNKAQQDALLPSVEEGTVILVGATTENPFFEVIAPLVSRSRVFRLESLSPEEIGTILERAMTDKERGLGEIPLGLLPEAREMLLQASNGDARIALNALEWGALTTPEDERGIRVLSREVIEEALQKKAMRYDKAADEHFETISAFIKSMRGCDPDATLYWLARMVYAGEDPSFIARRILICAAEDVGNADPQALILASSAAYAAQFVGFPEAQIILAQAATYVACAPKSNAAVKGIGLALEEVESSQNLPVPLHLRNPSTAGTRRMGYGQGYLYGHDYPGHFVQQEYLPKELHFRQYYYPSDQGAEIQGKERLEQWWGNAKKPKSG